MFDLFFLSFFAFIFFLLSIYLYGRADFQFLEKGKQFKLSRLSLTLIVVLIILVVAMVTNFLLNQASETTLQYFYILIFSISFFLSCFLFLPKTRFWFLFDFIITLLFLGVILKYHFPILENVFLAASYLWVAPVVLKKFKIKTIYLIFFFILFLFYDVVNIYLIKPDFAVFDRLVLGGSIVFGGSLLGIGDFSLAYLAVNTVRRDFSQSFAIRLAFFIAFANFFIYFLWPNYGNNIPYSVVITPTALFIYCLKFGVRNKLIN
jgi:hypothetical protein